ncbi:MAG: response regulator [Thermoplasmata archaeon]|nr:response regulator [Thermoplasmata archaeon]
MKILIVEDYEPSLDKLGAILTKVGHEVMSAKDGKTGLDKYRKDVFDIVFIDWTLPDMNGIDLASDIRDTDIMRHRKSYLILTTGRSKKRDMVEAMEAGIDDFMLKPYNKSVVLARLAIGKQIHEAREDKKPDSSDIMDILEKEHELVSRVNGIMEMTSNMLSEARPIPEKLILWATSSAFILTFQVHESKEDFYIERFIERAKLEHGKTSELFTRSSLDQIMKEHEIIKKLLVNMQNTIKARNPGGEFDIKKLKKYIDQYVELIRNHKAREDDIFFPFTMRYLNDDDIIYLEAEFLKIDEKVGIEKINARMKTLSRLEDALKINT